MTGKDGQLVMALTNRLQKTVDKLYVRIYYNITVDKGSGL